MKSPLPRSAPEAQGIASSALAGYIDTLDTSIHDMHSIMLLRHGRVVAEGWWQPFAPDGRHMLYSLSKSFTSTAVGLAVGEGRLSLDDKVVDLFPEYKPADSANLRAMRVRHLLSMSTGHAQDATGRSQADPEGNWARGFLSLPVEHEPGTHFVYNSAASYMLSAIVQKRTGMRISEYLRPRLFDPLQIADTPWQTCPRGIDVGGWGLSIRTEDIARFGQLYLSDGVWKGKRLLPDGWVAQASASHVSNGPGESDWNQGYGFQFWRCKHNLYRGDGAFGQFCIIMPKQDAVLAITSGVPDMQAVMNITWEKLLPAMQDHALPADARAVRALKDRCAKLAIPTLAGPATAESARSVSGRWYALDAKADQPIRVRLDFSADGDAITIGAPSAQQHIACGHGKWATSTASVDGIGPTSDPQPFASCSAWTDPQTWVGKLYAHQTPHCLTWTCRFADDRLSIERRLNLSFGPTELPTLNGRLEK